MYFNYRLTTPMYNNSSSSATILTKNNIKNSNKTGDMFTF